MGGVGFEAGLRVLLRYQLLRAWLWFEARAEFGARFRVLFRFWRFGAWLDFDIKVRCGCLIVVRIEECHD